ncbi:MAG: RNA-directed DNA polymerase [Myxococcales bacterium]|nr:RNA-directed DNA polymerase [Myxococcales bacterium]
MSEQPQTHTPDGAEAAAPPPPPPPAPAASPPEAAPRLTWDVIAEDGGIRGWIDAELRRRDLVDDGVDTQSMSDKQRKRYKARREQERRVRRELRKQAWACYREAHLVHLGASVFYHDTPDVDRYDIAEPEERLRENDLPLLKDARALADALHLSVPRLRWLTFHREVDSGSHYVRWTIPKRSGGTRLISSPKRDLKDAQRFIARKISEHLPVHSAAHGFLGGRSTVTNARAHAGAEVVIKLDIKDFYPTVTMPRVKGMFRKAGYGEQVATVLALLCTDAPREAMLLRGQTRYVATGPRSLPQGAPTSPSITNAICLRMDSRLSGLARKLGFRYTRYADDLTFSWHDGKKPAPVGMLLGGVRKIVSSEGFVVHPNKTRVMRKGRAQRVTGLVVNAAGEGAAPARVPRKLVRRLRAAIHNRERGKAREGETLAQLAGWAAYLNMTDPERAQPMLARIHRLMRGERDSSSGE